MSPLALLSLFPSPSSVTRWLSVVIGCAILEMAQPMFAADAPPPSPPSVPAAAAGARPDDFIIHPAGDPAPSAPARSGSGMGFSPSWVFVLLVGGASAGYWFWRRRRAPLAGRRDSIQIEDTRALGNRQFLVVASAGGRRFFLGVSPGGISLLAPLDPEDPEDAPDA